MGMPLNRPHLVCIAAAVLLTVLSPAREARASDWSVSPSVELYQEYNSNVLLAPVNVIEDFISVARPALLLEGRTEQAELHLDSVLHGELYARNEDLNTLNNVTTASLGYAFSPCFSLEGTGRFVKDKTLESELQAAGLPADRTDRYRYVLGLGGTLSATERLSFTVDGQWDSRTYPAFDSPYPDLRIALANLTPTLALTPRDSVGLRVTFSHADYQDEAVLWTLYANAFWERQWTQTDHLTLAAGYRMTRIDEDRVPGHTNEDGFLLLVRLERSWTPRFSTTLSAGRDHYLAVDVRNVERTYVRATVHYRLLEAVTVRCAVGYDHNAERGTGAEVNDYVRVAPAVQWRISEHWFLRVVGSYDNLMRERLGPSSTRERYRARVLVGWGWPRALDARL